MNNRIILGLIILVGATLGCKKSDNSDAERLPDPVLIRVTATDKLANISQANLYWYENGTKHGENDNTNNLDTRPFHLYYPLMTFDSVNHVATYDSLHPLLFSAGLVDISARKNINTFYISYGSSAVDTLNVTTEKIILSDGSMNKLKTISQHGAALPVDTFYRYEIYPVYRIQ